MFILESSDDLKVVIGQAGCLCLGFRASTVELFNAAQGAVMLLKQLISLLRE